mmetsp:Transcript_13064/g.40242  ORF Transcript_13064/g.40242 Transcript_13064/m.40242 type:complete len:116 (-) Transcript_13064:1126-1473(-)
MRKLKHTLRLMWHMRTPFIFFGMAHVRAAARMLGGKGEGKGQFVALLMFLCLDSRTKFCTDDLCFAALAESIFQCEWPLARNFSGGKEDAFAPDRSFYSPNRSQIVFFFIVSRDK